MRSTFVRSMWLDHPTKSDSPGVTVSDTWMFLISALSAALLGAACSTDGTAPEAAPAVSATQLVKSGGDQQAWYFNNPLSTPYAVTTLDEDDDPVPGVVVTWSVASGGGSVDPPQVGTDSSGLALATHILGPAAVSQSVTAGVPGLPTLTFNATATAPPTAAAVTVANNFFDPSDVIVQAGGTVVWTWNSAGVEHNVTYMGDPTLLPQSSATKKGGMHSNTYGTAAEYRYFCSIHGGMEGTVTVVR